MSRVLWCLLAVSLGLGWCGRASAQGLIWSIPEEEGRWVRYEGTYSQVMKRPDDPAGDLKLSWSRHLTIKALNTEEGEIDGLTVPCRWLEIKMITGPVKEGIIDAGPGGIRLYKILVPVEAISKVKITDDNQVLDADKVLATYVKIAKGYRKIGNESAAPIETGVFQVYPALTIVEHYRELKELGREDVNVREGTVSANHLQGEMVTEDEFTRSTNTADIWKSEDAAAPFGVAKWQVSLLVERKDSTESRDAFQPLSEVLEEMNTAEVGESAESELVLD
ncbi:MAG: hypothetical protein KDA75_03650 [Planctomycetaceae bacterium]|nr:hypothetical protein [Planctomycetaceae bacterium]